jgi:hypothetical protein
MNIVDLKGNQIDTPEERTPETWEFNLLDDKPVVATGDFFFSPHFAGIMEGPEKFLLVVPLNQILTMTRINVGRAN